MNFINPSIIRSTNGTYVNGKLVGKGKNCILKNGDEIALAEKLATKMIPHVASFVGIHY